MTDKCPACNVDYRDHLGLNGTCRSLQDSDRVIKMYQDKLRKVTHQRDMAVAAHGLLMERIWIAIGPEDMDCSDIIDRGTHPLTVLVEKLQRLEVERAAHHAAIKSHQEQPMLVSPLPGSIPGLLRRCSPVISLDDAVVGPSCRGVITNIHRQKSGSVYGVDVAWSVDGLADGAHDLENPACVALDLNDATGRTHAAWQVGNAVPPTLAEVVGRAVLRA